MDIPKLVEHSRTVRLSGGFISMWPPKLVEYVWESTYEAECENMMFGVPEDLGQGAWRYVPVPFPFKPAFKQVHVPTDEGCVKRRGQTHCFVPFFKDVLRGQCGVLLKSRDRCLSKRILCTKRCGGEQGRSAHFNHGPLGDLPQATVGSGCAHLPMDP